MVSTDRTRGSLHVCTVHQGRRWMAREMRHFQSSYATVTYISCHLCLHVLGTIAEREHRKWESAPPLPNNPYSPENINKRLRRQSTGLSSRSNSVASMWVLAGWAWNIAEPCLDSLDVRTSAGKHFLRGSVVVFVPVVNNVHRCILTNTSAYYVHLTASVV